jgi:hypothetical protein
MRCNIDARGKRFRLIAGIAIAAAGAGLIAAHRLALPTAHALGDVALYLGIALLAAGGLAIFEGWAGWCALRAIGFRTRV